MAYINQIKIGNDQYLIEPTLYITPTKEQNTNTYNFNPSTGALKYFSLENGVCIYVKFNTTNTGTPTLKINNVSKSILFKDSSIAANALDSDRIYTLVYDTTANNNNGAWQILDLYNDAQQVIVPNATSTVAGIVTLGASGGAATYEHEHGNISNSGYLINSSDQAIANAAMHTGANGIITASALTYNGPTTSGSATEFVTSVTQDSIGQITATKAALNTSGTWSGTANYAKYLLNRGANTVSIQDSEWSITHNISGETAGETVWHQAWAQSGLTYTPSGGSATTLNDTGNIRIWLSRSHTANQLYLNLDIDGHMYADQGFYGVLHGNAETATAWTNSRKIYVDLTLASTTVEVNGTSTTNPSAIGLGINGVLGVAHGGTGANLSTSLTKYGIIYADTTSTFNCTGVGSVGQVLITNNSSSAPSWYGGLTLSGNSSSGWLATFSGNINANGDVSVGDDLTVASTASITGSLSVNSTSTFSQSVGICTSPNTSYALTINGSTLIKNSTNNAAFLNTITKTDGQNTYYTVSFHPATSNTGTLGTTSYRWEKLYLGTANGYGDAYQPIYWTNGVPAITYPVQYFSWTINKNNYGISFSHACITADSYVLSLVIVSGESYLQAPLTCTSAAGTTAGTLTIQSTAQVTDAVSGYVIIARGTTINTTGTQITSIT